MAKATWIKVDGTWKEVKNVWEKVGGTWKEKVIPKVNISDAWKICISYGIIYTASSVYNGSAFVVSLQKRDSDFNVLESVQLGVGYRVNLISADDQGNLFVYHTNASSQKKLAKYTSDLTLVLEVTLFSNYTYSDMVLTNTNKLVFSVHYSTSRWLGVFDRDTLASTYYTTPSYYPLALDCDIDGNIYAVGGDNSQARWVSKFDKSTFAVIWTKTFSNNTSTRCNMVRVLDSYIYFGYSTNDTTGTDYIYKTPTSGYNSLVALTSQGETALAIDNFGNVLSIGGTYDEILYLSDTTLASFTTLSPKVSIGSIVPFRSMEGKDGIFYIRYDAFSSTNKTHGVVCIDAINKQILWTQVSTDYEVDCLLTIFPGRVSSFINSY